MKPVFAIVGVLLLIGSPLESAAQPSAPAPGARQAQLNRVRDGLNSPDPSVRTATLEAAVGSKDANLRRVALSTAFASSDGDLRAAALAAPIAATSSFVVDIVEKDPSNKSGYVQSRLGSAIEIRVRGAGRNAITFEASSSSSTTWRPSSVSGDRLSFEISIDKIFHDQAGRSVCRGVGRLQGGSATLKGTMNCSVFTCVPICNDFPENYSIAIDVPR